MLGMSRIILAKLDRSAIGVSMALSVVSAWLLVLFSGYIDFHPDETIYYGAIPISMRNDAGLFYHLYYAFFSDNFGGVTGARTASAILGGGTLLFILLSLRKIGAGVVWLGLASIVFILSYQSIFVFDRVRPEAAWWFLSAAMVYGMISLEKKAYWYNYLFVTVIAFLLPMNHQLSWFASAFIGGYILIFTRIRVGALPAFLLVGAFVAGALLNAIIRALVVSHDLGEALQGMLGGASAGGGIQNFTEYFHLVFIGSSIFLNDTAAYPNLYQMLGLEGRWVSHAFFQALFWLLMFILPFGAKNWNVRYALAFPLFAFMAFYITGYYNPTYSAGFSMLALFMALFLAVNSKPVIRNVVIGLCMFSIFNGLSFITTRVVNHGEASFFKVEDKLSSLIDGVSGLKKIAVSERFLSLGEGRDFIFFTNFKDHIPQDLDLLIYDDYDYNMYKFVPNHAEMSEEIFERANSMCLREKFEYPVYLNDDLFSKITSEGPYRSDSVSGSWFFRNSVHYTIYVFKQCQSEERIHNIGGVLDK